MTAAVQAGESGDACSAGRPTLLADGRQVTIRRLPDDGFVLGAFDAEDRRVAVARFVQHGLEPSAELMVEVDPGWRRVGLGSCLLMRLADTARQLGITRFTATYFADNRPVRRMLRRSGRLVATGVEQGEAYAVLDLTA